MLSSPIRTLSVLTLLSAVSGGVILAHEGQATAQAGSVQASGDAAASTIVRMSGERASRSAPRMALAADVQRSGELQQLRAERIQDVALGVKYRTIVAPKIFAERKAAALAARQARAKAAQQRRERAAARASRSSRSSGGSYSGDPKSIARAMLADRGWSGQFSCLDSLFGKESGWNYRASNPSSGAYGIPQALPGSKMASAGSDWRTNPATQIRWGLDYIASRYGSPCGAWSHSQSSGWY